MEGIRGTLHPLQTPIVIINTQQPILECITRNLSVSDLKSCRQVCRLWCSASAKAMRLSVKVKIRLDDLFKDRQSSQFWELLESQWSNFFKSPFVSSFEVCGDNQSFRFWEICGSQIKSLYLESATFESEEIFKKAIFHLCPNLENLILQYCCVKKDNDLVPIHCTLSKTFQNTNLKALTIKRSDLRDTVGLEGIIACIPSVEDLDFQLASRRMDETFRKIVDARKVNEKCWSLKRLMFNISTLAAPSEVIPFLVDGNLSLKTLKIIGIQCTKQSETVQKVVSAHATSLQKLFLIAPNFLDVKLFSLNIQVFKNLQELCLINFELRSLTILWHVPNLRKLELSAGCVLPPRYPEGLVLSKCTEVVFHHAWKPMDHLETWGEWLPNLKKLKICGLDNESFALVCQLWPNLVSLEISQSNIDDSGITGIDKKIIHKINRRRKRRRRFRKPITVRRANLTCLKHLQSLSLLSSGRRVPKPGFCAAILGVGKLRKLKHLQIKHNNAPVKHWDTILARFPWKKDKQ